MLDLKGIEPRERRNQVTDRCASVADTDQRPHREDRQHGELDAQQCLLEVRRDFNTDVTDPRHGHNPRDADEKDPHARRVVADTVGVEEVEHVLTGDLREARHNDDVGRKHSPATHPTNSRIKGPRGPGETRAAVGVGLIHLLEGERHAEHRYERQDRDDRRLKSDGDDDEAEGGRQTVRRSGGGDPDHGAGDQTQRPTLETLLRCRIRRFYSYSHVAPFHVHESVPSPPWENSTNAIALRFLLESRP